MIYHESPLVDLITYNDLTSGRTPWRENCWGVAEWVEAGQATAFSHWQVWRYHGDMLEAMQDAMHEAHGGGRWAVVCPDPDENWQSEKTLNKYL